MNLWANIRIDDIVSNILIVSGNEWSAIIVEIRLLRKYLKKCERGGGLYKPCQ